MRCAAHPGVETELRCSKCERPICPRCLVQTPVGARCRDCAQLRRLPTFQVGKGHLLRGAGAAAGSGIAAGIVWSMLPVGFGLFSFLLAAGVGYVVGEATSRAANRRRGSSLKMVAVAGVVLPYLVATTVVPLISVSGQVVSIAPLLAAAPALLLRALGNPFGLLTVALGGFIAAGRIG